MKRLACALMALLILFPLAVSGEDTHSSRYHDLYESMKTENAELSYAQLKEVTGGGDSYHDFPEYGLRLYDPTNCLQVEDEHHVLRKPIKKKYESAGIKLADEGLRIAYLDDEQVVGYNIYKVLNPEFEGCDKPFDFSSLSRIMNIYEENVFTVNGHPCAFTLYLYNSDFGALFNTSTFIRLSDNSVILVQGVADRYRGKTSDEKGLLSESEMEYPVYWEKNSSYLLCFTAMP